MLKKFGSRTKTTIHIGDIFEIGTPKGFGYIQYIRQSKSHGEFVRVLRPLLAERPATLDFLLTEPERFLTYFPVVAAYTRGIVEFVGNSPVPSHFDVEPTLRSPGKINTQAKCVESWWIVNGSNSVLVHSLTEEQKRLSIKSIINDTLLVEHLVSDWSPTDYV